MEEFSADSVNQVPNVIVRHAKQLDSLTCKFLPFEHGSEPWLAARRHTEQHGTMITASDIAVILGKSTTITPLELFKRKTHYNPQFTANRQFEYGLHMESLMLKWACEELGIAPNEAWCVNKLAQSTITPWALATPDALAIKDDELVAIEFKTRRSADLGDHSYQAQWQMYVLGVRRCYVCVLPMGNADKFEIVEHHYNPQLIEEQILPLALAFKQNCDNKIPPLAQAEDLSSLEYECDTFATITPELTKLVEQYKESTMRASASKAVSMVEEKVQKDLKAQIAQAMDKAEKAEVQLPEGKAFRVIRSTVNVPAKTVEAYSFNKLEIKEIK